MPRQSRSPAVSWSPGWVFKQRKWIWGRLLPAAAPPVALPWRSRAAFRVQHLLLLLPPALRGQRQRCPLLSVLGGCCCSCRPARGCGDAEDPSVAEDEASGRAWGPSCPGGGSRGTIGQGQGQGQRQPSPGAVPGARSRLDQGRSPSGKGPCSRGLRGGAAQPADPRAGSR